MTYVPPTVRRSVRSLRWQSQAVLLVLLPCTGVWAILAAGQAWQAGDPAVWQAAAISATFTALVFALRAATPGGALTGGLITAALYLETPGWHTALWPLFALFVLTFAATRFGRSRKEALGIAEEKRGRRASQVAANLGFAAMAGIPLAGALGFGSAWLSGRAALVAMLAVLAEATADTLSSELGQVLGGEPRLLTTLRRVPAGTDGGISLAGTLAGCLGAAIIAAIGARALVLHAREGLIAGGAGIFGLLMDSVLGAVVERSGWVNNDAVNALSTLCAALAALWACQWR